MEPRDRVRHPIFGIGEILTFKSGRDEGKVIVQFKSAGRKTLVLRWAKLSLATENDFLYGKARKLLPITRDKENYRSFLTERRLEGFSFSPRPAVTRTLPLLDLIELFEKRLDIIYYHRTDEFRTLSYFRHELVEGLLAARERLMIGMLAGKISNKEKIEYVEFLISELEAFIEAENELDFEEAKQLPWKLLPPEEMTLERLISHFEGLRKRRLDIVVEPERLKFIKDLGPDEWYVGEGQFEGYVMFYFSKLAKAVLECAVRGNAIYVLTSGRTYLYSLSKSDFISMSRLSKSALLTEYPNSVIRIIHKGSWQAKLQQALQ